MADEIEGGEVHVCRVALAELLAALREENDRYVPRPIQTVNVRLKIMANAEE